MQVYKEVYHKVVIKIPGTTYTTYAFVEDKPLYDKWAILNRALRISFNANGTPRRLIMDGTMYKIGNKFHLGAYVSREKEKAG